MSKIGLKDSGKDIVVKMSEGNPGAMTVIMECIKQGAEIDPESAMEGFGPILLLDSYEIYGSNIYIIWNDICNRNLRDFIMLLRCVQMGLLSINELKEQMGNGRGFPFDSKRFEELNNALCEKLTKFQKKENNIA